MKKKYFSIRSGYLEAQKLLAAYSLSTGSRAEMFDHNFQPIAADGSVEQNICRYCTAAAVCRAMHTDAMKESGRHGRLHIYQCELGLVFWVSPVYTDNTLSGCLRGSLYTRSDTGAPGSTVPAGTGPSALAATAAKCRITIEPQEFDRRIGEFPGGDAEKIHSLAEMLLLCAKSLSDDGGIYHETLRLRSKQMDIVSALVEKLDAKHGENPVFPGSCPDMERRLVISLRRGNRQEAEKNLNELLAALIFFKADDFRFIQLKALELAVLLARSGTHSGGAGAEGNARLIRQIQHAKTIDELPGPLHGMMENITASVTLFRGIPHASAMRKAEHFIRKNFTRKISLREIAGIAGLSPPYFSTIFKEEMGENLSRYINRLRVEKAGMMLLETDFSLADIASECCFEDQSWFSKTFKAFTGLSPGKYRSQGGN